MSSLRTLLSVNAIVGLTLIVGFANNVAIAGFFGLSGGLDAYFAALTVPSLVMALFIDYLGKNFLPVYSEIAAEGDTSRGRLVSSVVTIAVLIAASLAVLLWLLSAQVFKALLPGFDEQATQRVVQMFGFLAPAIVLMAVNVFHEYIWQYNQRYRGIVVCKMMLPVSILLFLLLGHRQIGIWALPAGYLTGHFVMFLVLCTGVGYRYRPTIAVDRHTRRIFVNSGVLVGTGMVSRARAIIERYFASHLAEGGLAALSLGNRLTTPIHRSAMTGIRMMTFSRSARLQAGGQQERVGDLVQRSVSAVLLVVVPVVIWMVLSRDELVRLLFERGRFDAEMSNRVSLVLLGIGPAVVFQCSNQLMSQSFYVLDRIKGIAILGPVGTGVYFLTILFMVGPLGILGIALATSLTTGFSFFVLLVMLHRQLERFSAWTMLTRLVTYATVAILSQWSMRWVVILMNPGDLIMLIGPAILAAVPYVVILWVLRDSALREIWSMMQASLRGGGGSVGRV